MNAMVEAGISAGAATTSENRSSALAPSRRSSPPLHHDTTLPPQTVNAPIASAAAEMRASHAPLRTSGPGAPERRNPANRHRRQLRPLEALVAASPAVAPKTPLPRRRQRPTDVASSPAQPCALSLLDSMVVTNRCAPRLQAHAGAPRPPAPRQRLKMVRRAPCLLDNAPSASQPTWPAAANEEVHCHRLSRARRPPRNRTSAGRRRPAGPNRDSRVAAIPTTNGWRAAAAGGSGAPRAAPLPLPSQWPP